MPDTNRIGASCWYEDNMTGVWRAGWLRCWSTDHNAPENNTEPFPVGVIEDESTGRCHSIYVEGICFAAVPPA